MRCVDTKDYCKDVIDCSQEEEVLELRRKVWKGFVSVKPKAFTMDVSKKLDREAAG